MITPSWVEISACAADGDLTTAFLQFLPRVESFLTARRFPKIVVKPNLCDNAAWETGVTTDPAWIPLLAKTIRHHQPDAVIQVVESDAVSAYRAFRSCDESYDRLGYREAALEAGVELINLSKEESWEVAVPNLPDPIRIPALFFEDFFFISIAGVKLHSYERFTGTMKNNYGLLPQAKRDDLHVYLSEILFTLHQLCRPDLAILDGRVGLEGKGPIIGRPKGLNRLIIGNDALAVDQTACRLIGLDPDTVPHLRYAARHIGQAPTAVNVLGDTTPVPFIVDDPATSSLIIRKFAMRRIQGRIERASLQMTNWFFDARRDPVAFCKRVARRFSPA